MKIRTRKRVIVILINRTAKRKVGQIEIEIERIINKSLPTKKSNQIKNNNNLMTINRRRGEI